MRTDKPGINNLVCLDLRREERVSGAWGQQTASFLPARQHGDRKGHRGRSLGHRVTSCQGCQGSGDKYIRVTRGATCLWLSPSVLKSPDTNLNSSQVWKTSREREVGAGAGGSQGLRSEVVSLCVSSLLALSLENKISDKKEEKQNLLTRPADC